MRLLITGASGLVGSAVARLAQGEVICATHQDADLRSFDQTKSLFEKYKPTHIIHAAARVGGIGANSAHPGEYFRDNLFINANVLECARLAGVSKVLSFLSTCIFPNASPYPLTEKSLHDGQPHRSNFGYAYAKRMIDVQNRAYRQEWGVNFVSVVGTNIYGLNDNFSLEDGHVLPSLIHKCYLAKKDGTPFRIWGSGKPLREFVYSDDIAKLALWALEHYNEEDPIMLTSGKETSISEVARGIATHMGFNGDIIFDSDKPDGQLRKPSDSTRLKALLPEFAFTSLEEGLRRTIEWFQITYPSVRM